MVKQNKKQKFHINSVSSVSQFIEKKTNKLITIVGEFHDNNFVCNNKNNISLFEYLKYKSNKGNCIFLLEYNEDLSNKTHIGSKIIRDVFNSGENNVKNKVVGIDIRSYFIGKANQQTLYNNDTRFYDMYINPVLFDKKTIYKYKKKLCDVFIKNYTESRLYKITGDLKSIKNKNDKRNLKEYLNYILKERNILNNFILKCNIDDFLNKDFMQKNILLKLRWLWAYIMDYHIIYNICLNKSKNNEFIVVVGNNHCINMTKVLSNWDQYTKLTDSKFNNKNNCIIQSNIYEL